ncbi:hypothetical protein BSKO_12603 [Bryopsis sp. KO-2023]|nr:hypothetical protein BSKO_12603 [Bryopsis sp. KO-2023]
MSAVYRRKRSKKGGIEDLGIFAFMPNVKDMPSLPRYASSTPASISPRSRGTSEMTVYSGSSLCGSQTEDIRNQERVYSRGEAAPLSYRSDVGSTPKVRSKLATEITGQDSGLVTGRTTKAYRTSPKETLNLTKHKSAPADFGRAILFPPLKDIANGNESLEGSKVSTPRSAVAFSGHSNTENVDLQASTQGAAEASERRINLLWKKFGGEKITNKALSYVSIIKGMDEISLTKGALERQRSICPLVAQSEIDLVVAPPSRSISWDVGMFLEPTGLSRFINEERFHGLDRRVQGMLLDDEEKVYTGSYGPKSFRKALSDKVIKRLVEVNPVAFEKDAAAQAEEEYRAAAEKARSKLRTFSMEPNDEKASTHLIDCIKDLRQERPFFNLPKANHEVPRRLEVVGRRRKSRIWQCETSLFSQRKKENDSRGLMDTEKALNKQFNLDWERIVTKSRFRRLVGREDAGVRKEGQGLEEELDEIRDELHAKRDILRMAFIYYSMMSGHSQSSNILQLSLNQWTIFTQDCDILDPKSLGSKSSDLDTMFVSTNFEEESGTHDAEANDDDALVRFEFLEIIIRASFGKYITTKILDDSSDSVQRMLEDKLLPNLPPEACINPNDFRKTRFYTQEMEASIKSHWDVLNAMFKLYKAKDKTKYFWIEHWVTLLESINLIGAHTGMEKREAKLIFAWSQMTVVDELKKRQRAVSLMFFDFIEAIARVAELISPPTEDDLEAFFALNGPPAPGSRLKDYYSRVGALSSEYGRESGHLCVPPTRPLQEKLNSLMELIVEGLKTTWGGNTKDQLVDRMKKMASRLSGGIELG